MLGSFQRAVVGLGMAGLLVVTTGCVSTPYRRLEYTTRRFNRVEGAQRTAALYCANLARQRAKRSAAWGTAATTSLSLSLVSSGVWIGTRIGDSEPSSPESTISGAAAITTAIAAGLFAVLHQVASADAAESADTTIRILDDEDFDADHYRDCKSTPSEQKQ